MIKDLKTKYPDIIPENARLGCGDGWYQIIDCLCNLIQQHITQRTESIEWCEKFNADLERAQANDWQDWNPLWRKTPWEIPEPIAPVSVAQVKEKFGTLRFYYDGGDEYIRGAVTLAEFLSAHTCEVCGAKGKAVIIRSSWKKTRCDAHVQS